MNPDIVPGSRQAFMHRPAAMAGTFFFLAGKKKRFTGSPVNYRFD